MLLSNNSPHELQPIKSTAQDFAAGRSLKFKGFLPAIEKGRRVVIDGITVNFRVSDYNVATTAIQGEDFWRFIKRLTVTQIDGVVRRNLTGYELRQMCFYKLGPNGVADYADSSVANDQSGEFAFYIPFEDPYAYGPKDFCLPADLLKEIVVECGELGSEGLGISGGTVTVDDAEVYITAHCHLDKSAILYAVDVWESQPFNTTNKVEILPHGRLADLFLMKDGASGGAALTNLTSVRIQNPTDIMPQELYRDPDLVEAFLRSRGDTPVLGATVGSARTSNPAANDKCCPVLWTTPGVRTFDPALADVVDVRVTLGGTLADPIAVYRTIQARSQRLEAVVEAAYRVDRGSWRVKTRDKTKRSPSQWRPEEAMYLPLSGASPRLRG